MTRTSALLCALAALAILAAGPASAAARSPKTQAGMELGFNVAEFVPAPGLAFRLGHPYP